MTWPNVKDPVQYHDAWIGTNGGWLYAISGAFSDRTRWNATYRKLGPSAEEPRRYGSDTNQNAGLRTFPTRESAAIEALGLAYRLTDIRQKEYGGLICAVGKRFELSDIVTSNDQNSVLVPDNLCSPGLTRAHYHTHTRIELSGAPTDPDDYLKADARPGIPYYLRAPHPNASVLLTIKYWNGAGRTARQNLCYLSGNSWLPYEPNSGAICATPQP